MFFRHPLFGSLIGLLAGEVDEVHKPLQQGDGRFSHHLAGQKVLPHILMRQQALDRPKLTAQSLAYP